MCGSNTAYVAYKNIRYVTKSVKALYFCKKHKVEQCSAKGRGAMARSSISKRHRGHPATAKASWLWPVPVESEVKAVFCVVWRPAEAEQYDMSKRKAARR